MQIFKKEMSCEAERIENVHKKTEKKANTLFVETHRISTESHVQGFYNKSLESEHRNESQTF